MRKGAVTFAVRVKGRARKVTVRVSVTPPGAGPDRASKRVTVSR